MLNTASKVRDVLLIPKREAAHLLGISERTLYRKIKEYALPY